VFIEAALQTKSCDPEETPETWADPK